MKVVPTTYALGGRASWAAWPNPGKYPYVSVRYWIARSLPPCSFRKLPRTRKSCGGWSLQALVELDAAAETGSDAVELAAASGDEAGADDEVADASRFEPEGEAAALELEGAGSSLFAEAGADGADAGVLAPAVERVGLEAAHAASAVSAIAVR